MKMIKPFNFFSLSNKTFLITGASSGIGKATALAVAAMGGNVIITGRNLDRLKSTFILLSEGNHKMIQADLKDENQLIDIVHQINSIDGIVHSAGMVKTLPIKFIGLNEIREIMSVNFEMPVILTQKLLKAKKIKNGGSIVFISSIAGNLVGQKGNGIYSASKGALNGIMKVMCVELSNQKIRANCICPGMVKTEMTQNEDSSITKEQLLFDESKYPLGYGEPEDVAYGAVYLLSNASKWVSGTSLILDGGFTITN